ARGVPRSRGRAGQGRGDAALLCRGSAPAGRTAWSGRVHAFACGSRGEKPRGGRRAAARPLAPASVGEARRARPRPLLPAARAPDGPGARSRLMDRQAMAKQQKSAPDESQKKRPAHWEKRVSAAYLRILGATQAEAARAVGRSARTIRLWES